MSATETPEKLAQITPPATEKELLNAAGGGGISDSNYEPMRRVKRNIVSRSEVNLGSIRGRFMVDLKSFSFEVR